MSECSNEASRRPALPRGFRAPLALLGAGLLAGCASLGASGPTASRVNDVDSQAYDGQQITLIDLNRSEISRIARYEKSRTFAGLLGESVIPDDRIGIGDTLDISIWEAPPAVLFGASGGSEARSAAISGAQTRNLPEQIVSTAGTINVPFVGTVTAAGRTPAEIEREIASRLAGRANNPQVIVRTARNETRTVTVMGEVASSRQVPLGPRAVRLLDIVASAGGPRQPVSQSTVQLTRGTTSVVMPLEAVIADPEQNIRVNPDDVVTVMHQPFSFIALGAVARSAEIPFEGNGISLAQALGRMGGLRDDRADIKGVFVFRMEDPAALDPAIAQSVQQTMDGRVPVVYRLNLADAAGFFVAQDFAIRDKDILYVSTAPGADLQRFLSTISSLAFSFITISDNLAK